MSNWKLNFSSALKIVLESITHTAVSTDDELFNLSKNLPYDQRRGMWNEVAKILNAAPNEVRDFYHNTWVTRFYASVNCYKDDLKRIVEHMG